jgi:hypothetical protein
MYDNCSAETDSLVYVAQQCMQEYPIRFLAITNSSSPYVIFLSNSTVAIAQRNIFPAFAYKPSNHWPRDVSIYLTNCFVSRITGPYYFNAIHSPLRVLWDTNFACRR